MNNEQKVVRLCFNTPGGGYLHKLNYKSSVSTIFGQFFFFFGCWKMVFNWHGKPCDKQRPHDTRSASARLTPDYRHLTMIIIERKRRDFGFICKSTFHSDWFVHNADSIRAHISCIDESWVSKCRTLKIQTTNNRRCFGFFCVLFASSAKMLKIRCFFSNFYFAIAHLLLFCLISFVFLRKSIII